MGSAIIGLLTAVGLTAFALSSSNSDTSIYINLSGILFVVGGSFSATAITFSLPDLGSIFVSFWSALRRREMAPEKIVENLVDVSKILTENPKAYERSKNEANHHFTKDGLDMIENGFPVEKIENILITAVSERRNTVQNEIEVLRTMAKYPPAFGMIGTVLGLVALLHGLGVDSSTASIGANMSIALGTTLYGLLLANYIFLPMSDNLLTRLKHDLHIRRIIVEAILLIKEGEDPVIIQETLNAFVKPKNRVKRDLEYRADSNIGKPA